MAEPVHLEEATVFLLEIPLTQVVTHATQSRSVSDAIVCRVRSSNGTVGYGEGLARPYVTGETRDGAVDHLKDVLWPSIVGAPLGVIETPDDLGRIDAVLTDATPEGVVAAHTSRTALELAAIDCVLRAAGRGLGAVLPPRRDQVRYSGVVTAGAPDEAAKLAARMHAMGLRDLKVKVAHGDDVERVKRVAEATGGGPLRLDANGGWSVDEAIEQIGPLEALGVVEAIEAPIRRTSVDDLRRFRESTSIPIVVDEYLVTFADGEQLVAAGACDIFNLRVSKCGGLWRTWRLAQLARAHGIGIQVGAQVGETAVLSAAGRHLAAALEELRFVEGSFGTLLLAEDVSREPIAFGPGGLAPTLEGPGLGIEVDDAVLEKYAKRVVELR